MKRLLLALSVATCTPVLAEGLSHEVDELASIVDGLETTTTDQDSAIADLYLKIENLPPLTPISIKYDNAKYRRFSKSQYRNGENISGSCLNIVWNEESRESTPEGEYITESITFVDNAGGICYWQEETILSNEVGTHLVEYRSRNSRGYFVDTPDEPILLIPTVTYLGIPFNGAGVLTRTYDSGETSQVVHVDQRVNVAIEEVTVPAGTFYNCVRRKIRRTGTLWGTNDMVRWTCPGVGFVKELRVYNDGVTTRVSELVEYHD